MHKLSIASSCLAALILTAGCTANQGGGFVPSSLTSADHSTASANGEHRYGPDTGSSIVEFNAANGFFGFSGYITSDFAGNEWLGSSKALVAIDEHTGLFTQFSLPPSYFEPYGLAMNPAHDVLWFTDPGSNAIGYMNLYNHTTAEFTIPTYASSPTGITAGPNHTMWFTETLANKIGKFDTITQTFTEYHVPHPYREPYRITLGPDGALWFTTAGFARPGGIGRITTHGHAHVYSIGQNSPTGITTGPDGGVWFTGQSDHVGSMLGRIDPHTHVRKIYKYGSGKGGNWDLTVRDSDFWMTRASGDRIDRFDHTTHIIHSRPLPHGYELPKGIALGTDDQLWFYNEGFNAQAVGKLCPGLPESQCKGAF